MDTTALRWFQLVSDGYTVTEVSDIFGVSQPGVSRALTKLEKEVGTPLLRRSGRVLRMTHAGVAFKRHVDSVVHNLDDGLAAVNALLDPEGGVVTLAYPLSLGSWLVPRLVDGFRREHPRVRIILSRTRVAEEGRASRELVARRADLELAAHRVRGDAIVWRRILEEPLVLALPPTHRLADQAEVALTEVAKDPFVVRSAPSKMGERALALCREAGFEPQVGYEAEDVPTVLGFVAAGLGVAVVPAQGLRPPTTFARARMVALADEGARREIGLAWLEDRPLLPSAQAFRRFVLTRGG